MHTRLAIRLFIQRLWQEREPSRTDRARWVLISRQSAGSIDPTTDNIFFELSRMNGLSLTFRNGIERIAGADLRMLRPMASTSPALPVTGDLAAIARNFRRSGWLHLRL